MDSSAKANIGGVKSSSSTTEINRLPYRSFNWFQGSTSATASSFTGTTNKYGIGFTAPITETLGDTNTGTYGYVGMYIYSIAGTPPTYRLGIQASSGGLPDGTFIASGTFTPTSGGWKTVQLDDYVTLTAGIQYFLVVQYESGTLDINNIAWFNYFDGRAVPDLPIQMNGGEITPYFYDGSLWSIRVRSHTFFVSNSVAQPYHRTASYDAYGTHETGQRVKFQTAQSVSEIGFYVFKTGSPAGDLEYKIYDSTNTAVRSGTLATAAQVTTSYAKYHAHLSSDLTIPANSTYRFVISSPSSINISNAYNLLIFGSVTTGISSLDSRAAGYGSRDSAWIVTTTAGVTTGDNTYYDAFFDLSFVKESNVKANIVGSVTKNSSSKASLFIPTQDNNTKANISISDISYENNVKAEIIYYLSYDNDVKSSIQPLPGTEPSSAKGNIANTAIRQKKFDYRVFDANTKNYVTTWSSEVISVPTFKMVINSGPGEMQVKLARKFDSFGEEVDVKLFNKVECWVYDLEAPSGMLLYSGYISGYTPVMEELKEYVLITLLPFSAELSSIILRDGAGDTEITQTSQDPSQIFKNIITYYKADAPGHIDYTDSTIDTTSTVVTYTFRTYTIKEALDKGIELTPNNWYWRIDADNLLYLKQSNITVADHTFLIGKHINHLETQRRGEDLFNRIYFVGAETAGVALYRVYSNSASITSYNIHAYKQVDSRVAETATADIMANRTLARKKDPEIRTTITIVDSNGFPNTRGYDIESVKPGQTMRIKNIKEGSKTVSTWDAMVWDVDVWDQTLSFSAADIIQIQSVTYTPNAIVIQASSRTPEISKRIEDINRNWEENAAKNTPATPTVV